MDIPGARHEVLHPEPCAVIQHWGDMMEQACETLRKTPRGSVSAVSIVVRSSGLLSAERWLKMLGTYFADLYLFDVAVTKHGEMCNATFRRRDG